MATIHDFEEAQKKRATKTNSPSVVTFHSAAIRDIRQIPAKSSPIDGSVPDDIYSTWIVVPVEDGDHAALIVRVMQNYGIWNDEGTVFIPWPCALVTIKDADQESQNGAGANWRNRF